MDFWIDRLPERDTLRCMDIFDRIEWVGDKLGLVDDRGEPVAVAPEGVASFSDFRSALMGLRDEILDTPNRFYEFGKADGRDEALNRTSSRLNQVLEELLYCRDILDVPGTDPGVYRKIERCIMLLHEMM